MSLLRSPRCSQQLPQAASAHVLPSRLEPTQGKAGGNGVSCAESGEMFVSPFLEDMLYMTVNYIYIDNLSKQKHVWDCILADSHDENN